MRERERERDKRKREKTRTRQVGRYVFRLGRLQVQRYLGTPPPPSPLRNSTIASSVPRDTLLLRRRAAQRFSNRRSPRVRSVHVSLTRTWRSLLSRVPRANAGEPPTMQLQGRGFSACEPRLPSTYCRRRLRREVKTCSSSSSGRGNMHDYQSLYECAGPGKM